MSQKIALGVSYRGTDFHGWQFQNTSIATVQMAVEKALSVVADHPVQVTCAGRTDAGVHATKQVVHFETQSTRSTKAWTQGVNAHLPDQYRLIGLVKFRRILTRAIPLLPGDITI